MKNKKKIITLFLVLSLFLVGCLGQIEENKKSTELTNKITINTLEERIESYVYREGMFRKENDNYHFSDEYMISQAIRQLNWNEYEEYMDDYIIKRDIPFSDVDDYIRANFNVTSYEYENFEAWVSYAEVTFNKSKNVFVVAVIPTGGMFDGVIPTFNISPITFIETDDYYYVYATVITVFQDGQEYFCAEGSREQVKTEVFDNLDFVHARFNATVEVDCHNTGDWEVDLSKQKEEFKTKINFVIIQSAAPQYRFVFTKDMRFARIEIVH